MQFNELSQDSLNAELDYRRTQLLGADPRGQAHVRRIWFRRTRTARGHRAA